MLSIKLFPAEYGDCIMVSVGKEKPYHILIDGGLSKTYQKHIKPEIQRIKEMEQKIDLMVCTHMDNDHICGLIQFLKEINSVVEGQAICSELIPHILFIDTANGMIQLGLKIMMPNVISRGS